MFTLKPVLEIVLDMNGCSCRAPMKNNGSGAAANIQLKFLIHS